MIEFDEHAWSTLCGRTKKSRVSLKEKAVLPCKIMKLSLREESAV
jgi:hypothetical protein